MKKTLLSLALALTVGGAQADVIPGGITLTSLLAGASITAGDKLFSDWTYIFFDSSDAGRALNTNNIEVTALNDGGDYGLRFNILNGEFDVTGDGFYAYLDYTFGFKVSVLGAGMAINGVMLAGPFGSITTTAGPYDDLGMYVAEWVGGQLMTPTPQNPPPDLEGEFSAKDGVVHPPLPDSLLIAPVSSLWVTKNILVWAYNVNETASLLGFEQRFSQVQVPEPATLALFGLGLLGLGLARRRT